MYAAAWAHTSRPARAAQAVRAAATPAVLPPATIAVPDGGAVGRTGPDPRLAFGAGAATALGLVALVRRVRR